MTHETKQIIITNFFWKSINQVICNTIVDIWIYVCVCAHTLCKRDYYLLDGAGTWRLKFKLLNANKVQVVKPYLQRAFNFDQHDNAFVAGGGASRAGVATGGGISLITVVLPWFLVHKRPLGSLRQARHLIPGQHLQYWLKDLPQRANNFSLSRCFSLLARTLQQKTARRCFIIIFF